MARLPMLGKATHAWQDYPCLKCSAHLYLVALQTAGCQQAFNSANAQNFQSLQEQTVALSLAVEQQAASVCSQ